jgi:transcriptional regulator with XRE-family HTH domain
MVAEQFAANIRRYRKLADISQGELATRASLHLTAVGMIERGTRLPRVDTVAKLAGALEVEPGELFEGIVWKPGDVRLGNFKIPDKD